MLEAFGTWGYQLGAFGIVLLTIGYLVAVPWWNNLLGRLIAGVLFSLSSVLVVITLRQLGIELPGGLMLWRAIVFSVFGLAVWTAFGTFIWAQFFAPRIKARTTRRDSTNESEASLAGRRDNRDGGPDRPSGRPYR